MEECSQVANLYAFIPKENLISFQIEAVPYGLDNNPSKFNLRNHKKEVEEYTIRNDVNNLCRYYKEPSFSIRHKIKDVTCKGCQTKKRYIKSVRLITKAGTLNNKKTLTRCIHIFNQFINIKPSRCNSNGIVDKEDTEVIIISHNKFEVYSDATYPSITKEDKELSGIVTLIGENYDSSTIRPERPKPVNEELQRTLNYIFDSRTRSPRPPTLMPF